MKQIMKTTFNDPIVAEIREIREKHAAKFGYDLDKIFDDLERKEKASGREYVNYPPRPARNIKPPEK